MLIDAQDVSLSFGASCALRGVNIRITENQTVAIIGPSGSGKTSLLYCLAGLVRPSYGRVVFDGLDLASLDGEALAAVRRRDFGFVFQFAELVAELTLRENVGLPLELGKIRGRELRSRVDEMLALLDLSEHADRRPAQVSGGQAQRAAVALVHRPRVVFADEPTGSLDTVHGEQVLELLLSHARASGSSVVLVTHDLCVAAQAGSRVHIRDGLISELS